MRAQALTRDLPGRSFDSKGQGRHALEREVGPRKQEAIEFARRLATRLEVGRLRGAVERFVLVAPPEFLGLLRGALGAEERKLVASEHALNLVGETPAEIRGHLPERLYSTLAAR
jgi:protein required for attachment to host cells